MKKVIGIFLILACLAGCGNPDTAILYRTIYDDIADVLLLENANSTLYENILDAANDYIKSPSPEKLEMAKQRASEGMQKIVSSQVVKSGLTDRETNFMMRNGIDIVDYKAFFSQQEYNKNCYAEDISNLIFYLDNVDALAAQLSETTKFKIRMHQASRQINAIAINHLFANVSDGDLTYFRTEILTKLDSLMQDNMPWVNDKAILEEKADVVFGEMETAVNEYEILINSMEIDLLAKQKSGE